MVGDREPDYELAVASFAAELNRLRLDAGSPTLTRLESLSGISRSAISEAFAGRKLPSARTVASLVKACGTEPASLLKRRDEIEKMRIQPAPAEIPARASRRQVAWWWLPVAAVAGGVLVLGAQATLTAATNDALM